MHPLPAVLNQGVPVTLNSDDPAVFGTRGLSYDYFQVLVSSETTGLITLAQMARDSIEVRLGWAERPPPLNDARLPISVLHAGRHGEKQGAVTMGEALARVR
jgi:hypothetical protein